LAPVEASLRRLPLEDQVVEVVPTEREHLADPSARDEERLVERSDQSCLVVDTVKEQPPPEQPPLLLAEQVVDRILAEDVPALEVQQLVADEEGAQPVRVVVRILEPGRPVHDVRVIAPARAPVVVEPNLQVWIADEEGAVDVRDVHVVLAGTV